MRMFSFAWLPSGMPGGFDATACHFVVIEGLGRVRRSLSSLRVMLFYLGAAARTGSAGSPKEGKPRPHRPLRRPIARRRPDAIGDNSLASKGLAFLFLP